MSPTFVFVCDNCKYEETSYRPITIPKVTVCPNCGKNSLIKYVGTSGGFSISGNGVYKPGWHCGTNIREGNRNVPYKDSKGEE